MGIIYKPWVSSWRGKTQKPWSNTIYKDATSLSGAELVKKSYDSELSSPCEETSGYELVWWLNSPSSADTLSVPHCRVPPRLSFKQTHHSFHQASLPLKKGCLRSGIKYTSKNVKDAPSHYNLYSNDVKVLVIGHLSSLKASVNQNLILIAPVVKGFPDGNMPPLKHCRHK